MNDDSKSQPFQAIWTRRKVLRTLGSAAAVAPLAQLLGCGSDDTVNNTTSGAGGAGSTASTTDSTSGATSTSDSATSSTTASTATSTSTGGEVDWATGGTDSMSGNYPDPFSGGIGPTCDIFCASTLGPCYAQTIDRKDISEGEDGLPVRLAFLVVDENCNPVPGAPVDIWHTTPRGTYSGDDAPQNCTLGDQAAKAARYFRGIQTADENGRVDFDTCFPGWYSGRTIHIHFTVRVNDTVYVTSQLFFDDTLCDEIIATQPIYNERGDRDTNNQNDNVLGGADPLPYTFQAEKQADGAMLAWKALVLRSSLADPLCWI